MIPISGHPEHIWARMSSGVVRCAYQGCPARPSAAEVERVEADMATAARMRVHLDMTPLTGEDARRRD